MDLDQGTLVAVTHSEAQQTTEGRFQWHSGTVAHVTGKTMFISFGWLTNRLIANQPKQSKMSMIQIKIKELDIIVYSATRPEQRQENGRKKTASSTLDADCLEEKTTAPSAGNINRALEHT